jgi:Porin subfamily
VTSTNFNANRAFIQFAGFTIGTARSFFDFYSSPASAYWGALASDTGDGGWKVFAYTLQFGNGFSTTFSAEEPRNMGTAVPTAGVINTNFGNAGLVLGTIALDPDRAKERFPDLVNNWRIDQAWGSAQIMGAVHDVSAGYYANTAGLATGVRDRYCWYPRRHGGWLDHPFRGLRPSCRQARLGGGHWFEIQSLPR